MTFIPFRRCCGLLLPVALMALEAPPTPSLPATLKGCDREQEPFLVPAAEVRGSVRTIAMMPVVSEREFSASVLARMVVLDSLLDRELRGGRFAVITARVTDSVWQSIQDAGEAADEAEPRFRRALQEGFGADAVLHPTLLDVDAEIGLPDLARWDGAKQHPSSLSGKAISIMSDYLGPTEALSLGALLQRSDGTPIYEGRGGLQLTVVPRSGKFMTVPDGQLLTNRKWMAESVRIALCPLLKQAGH